MTRLSAAFDADVDRYVTVRALGPVDVGEDSWVTAPDAPPRRLLRRLSRELSDDEAYRKLVARIPRAETVVGAGGVFVECGVDREGRVCLLFRPPPLLPRALAWPRNASEAARLTLEVIGAAEIAGGAWTTHQRHRIRAEHVDSTPDGGLFVRSLLTPSPLSARPRRSRWRQAFRGNATLLADAADLARVWGAADDLDRARTVGEFMRGLEEIRGNHARDVRTERLWSAHVHEGHDALVTLKDPDRTEEARVAAALTIAKLPHLADEVAPALVAILNEPLRALAPLAVDLLAERDVPLPVRLGRDGLVVPCWHAWARLEVVDERVRYCADCDARTALAHDIGALAGLIVVGSLLERVPDES